MVAALCQLKAGLGLGVVSGHILTVTDEHLVSPVTIAGTFFLFVNGRLK